MCGAILLRRGAALISGTVLLVVLGCSSTRYERSVGEYVDDQTLNRRVKHALDGQPVYKYPDIHVHSYRGVVQLSGFVATEEQRRAAGEIAEHVRGVAQVENVIGLAPVADRFANDYIPGRDTNSVNASGRPGRSVDTTTGGAVGTVTNDFNRPVR